MRRLDMIVEKVSHALRFLGSITIILIIGLVVSDVIARYVLQTPLIGLQDFIEIGMSVLIIGSMGYMIRSRRYIRADILSNRLSDRNFAIVNVYCTAIMLIIVIIWTWQTFVDFINGLKHGAEGTVVLDLPVVPVFAFIAFGLFVVSLEVFLDMFRYASEVKTAKRTRTIKEPEYEEMSMD